MGKHTGIQFADSTRNLVMGCDGCELWTPKMEEEGTATCYAALITKRYAGRNGWPASFGEPTIFHKRIDASKDWELLQGKARADRPWLDNCPRVIFECDMSDAFTESLPLMWMEPFIDRMQHDGHIHMFITKRPRRAATFFENLGYIPENFWIYTTITSNKNLNRLKDLMKLREIDPKVILGVSAEPLYETISLDHLPLDHVILGFESGPNCKVPSINVAYAMLGNTREAHAKFFMKQLGGHPNKHSDMQDFPPALRIREMPLGVL